MSERGPIYIVDQITPLPGQGEAYLKAYMERYVGPAKERGMTLEHSWVAPPLWLKDQSNTLFFVWTVEKPEAVWMMNIGARANPSVMEWWDEAEKMTASRHRYIMTDPSKIEAVGKADTRLF